MRNQEPAVLSEISVSLPFGIGSAKWTTDPIQRNAAWSLYIELITRIAVQPLGEEQGLLREAIDSLYTIFSTTREILKDAGPKVGASKSSVGGIAIAVLNNGLRPFLSKWHPVVQRWELQISRGDYSQAYEKKLEHELQLRQELELLYKDLAHYADALAKIAGV